MQRRKKQSGNIFLLTILGISWIVGILMAGSESSYMPWFNLLGLFINGLASYLLCRIPDLKQILEC